MSEAGNLRSDIEELSAKKEQCARRAWLLADRCAGLRADNANDPRTKDLSLQVDALDELHDRYADIIGRMQLQLSELENAHALRCRVSALNLSEY